MSGDKREVHSGAVKGDAAFIDQRANVGDHFRCGMAYDHRKPVNRQSRRMVVENVDNPFLQRWHTFGRSGARSLTPRCAANVACAAGGFRFFAEVAQQGVNPAIGG